jgi:ribosomal protein S11
MEMNSNLDFLINNLGNYKFKKVQNISNILQSKIFFLNIKTTLNNIYLTITDKFGKVVVLRSGGMSKLGGLKRNTGYTLELMLLDILKRLLKNPLSYVILRLDIQSLRKKKIIIKFLQKFNVKVLYIQLQLGKAFNGVRLRKIRRI